MFAPGRAGELSNITVDCLHYGENGSLGIRWYAEKGFGHTIKWVPEALKGVVLEAHQRLMLIGQPAREASKFAFDNPGVFLHHNGCCTLSEFPDNKSLNAYEFACAMNLIGKNIKHLKCKIKDRDSELAWNYLRANNTKWVQELRSLRNPTYNDLAKYVSRTYQKSNWPNLGYIKRPIWDSLILIRDREFHNQFSVRNFSWRLPSVNDLNDQLTSRVGLKHPLRTIFQRMGYKDEDCSEISLTSHQLRVWLSTNAERGGMDTWLLARWAGRARINDNRHYDLRTQDEREKQAKRVMEFTERPTALQAIKLNLPVSYKDLGLNRIGIADVTEYGMCTHDYAMSPCTKGGECMSCKEHVCIKGMPNTLERIIRLEEQVNSQFTKAKNDDSENIFGADRWVTHLGWKLAHIRTQRQRLESEDTPEGAILWIPPEHDPSPVKRALEQRDLDISTNKKDRINQETMTKLLGIENA